MCQFMFLRSTRRSCQEPKIGLEPGSLAVLCPACPQPHKNMDPDRHLEDEDPNVSAPLRNSQRLTFYRYLDMLFYTIDGNFQAAQKFKPMDMTDFPITTGGAYYAPEPDYEVYRTNLPPRRKEVGVNHSLPNSTDYEHLISRLPAASSEPWVILVIKGV